MTLALNDDVLITNDSGKPEAMGLSSLAMSDDVIITPVPGQKSVAVQEGSLAVSDDVFLIPGPGNKFIALKSGITYTPGTCITKWSATFAIYGGIWVDKNNNIWVVDSSRTVTKYRPNGTVALTFTDTTHLSTTAVDLVTDSAGNIYVIGKNDLGYGQVVKYDPSGTFLSLLNETGSLYYWDLRIAIDSKDNIWLPEHKSGTSIYVTTEYTASPWAFSRSISALGPVTGIDIKGSTYLYVLLGNAGVVKFTISSGSIAQTWTYPGSFNSPYGLAVDVNLGYIYVSDSVNNTITVLNPDGTLKATWTGYVFDGTTYAFSTPLDIAMDDNYHLYVADTGSAQILKLQGLRS